jgi:hypothetical protein
MAVQHITAKTAYLEGLKDSFVTHSGEFPVFRPSARARSSKTGATHLTKNTKNIFNPKGHLLTLRPECRLGLLFVHFLLQGQTDTHYQSIFCQGEVA